jgi:hypothetical protein
MRKCAKNGRKINELGKNENKIKQIIKKSASCLTRGLTPLQVCLMPHQSAHSPGQPHASPEC